MKKKTKGNWDSSVESILEVCETSKDPLKQQSQLIMFCFILHEHVEPALWGRTIRGVLTLLILYTIQHRLAGKVDWEGDYYWGIEGYTTYKAMHGNLEQNEFEHLGLFTIS